MRAATGRGIALGRRPPAQDSVGSTGRRTPHACTGTRGERTSLSVLPMYQSTGLSVATPPAAQLRRAPRGEYEKAAWSARVVSFVQAESELPPEFWQSATNAPSLARLATSRTLASRTHSHHTHITHGHTSCQIWDNFLRSSRLSSSHILCTPTAVGVLLRARAELARAADGATPSARARRRVTAARSPLRAIRCSAASRSARARRARGARAASAE